MSTPNHVPTPDRIANRASPASRGYNLSAITKSMTPHPASTAPKTPERKARFSVRQGLRTIERPEGQICQHGGETGGRRKGAKSVDKSGQYHDE